MAERRLRCYAHGRDSSWEAICIDLDLAVHGRSLVEVQQLLTRAIETYIEDARREDPATARRLLDRRAPFLVRARHTLGFLGHLAFSGDSKGDYQANFELPCPA